MTTHCNDLESPCADRAIERAEVDQIERDPFGMAADYEADRYERQMEERW